MKRLTLAVIGCLVFLPFVVQAHTPIDGVTVGMLPQSPWFPLKLVGEQVATFFTFSATMKFERELRLAGLRLSETQAMCEDAENCAATALTKRYQKQLERAERAAARVSKKDQEKVSEKLKAALAQHDVSLSEIRDDAPSNALEALTMASERSHQTLRQAFDSVTKNLTPDLQQRLTEEIEKAETGRINAEKLKQKLGQ